jgi:hypothetical protein
MGMSRRLAVVVVAALVCAGVTTLATGDAEAAALTASLVRTVDTSAWTTPSPDPAGITYDAAHNRLVLSDSEVDEMPLLYQDRNVFFSTLDGQQTAGDTGWTTLPWSHEPAGISYQTAGHFLVSDDDLDRVFLVDTGGDGVWTSGVDATPSSFTTRPLDGDAEDLTMDMDATTNGHVLVIDGVNTDIYDYGPGPNGTFDALPPGGDDTRVVFDVGQYGALNPEGIEYYPSRNTILVLDSDSRAIYELDRQGRLINVVSIAAGGPRHAAGITLAPPSDGTGGLNLYIVDRGVDNDSNPGENDGRFYEMRVTLPDLGDSTNRSPQVSAGPDLGVSLSTSASLVGSVSDDGLPDPPRNLSVAWSTVSGPGTVVFANSHVASTRATFGAVGTYVLRLTVSDGEMTARDDVSVVVSDAPPNGAVALDVPTLTGSDDAEERSASVSVSGTDLELVVDGTTTQIVGIRFPGVGVPGGATITRAFVQFSVDEATSVATDLTVRGVAADDTPGFTTTSHDVSSRQGTTAAVGWVPPAWPTAGARGLDQRTPDLAPVLQEIVGRPGWVSGNALALVVTGSGTRTASATERGFAKAPVLHLEFLPVGGPNAGPSADAGPDTSVTMPGAVSLGGTVSDDGLPNPPATVTAAWSTVSGPGTVTFADAAADATTATFSAAGTYVLRLTADDGVLLAADDVTVTVAAAPVNQAPTVSAGPDRTVTMPGAVSLAGSVSDDGLPTPPAVTAGWTTVSGPGTVVFADPSAGATTATFSAAGTYVLRLTGSDGELQTLDDVTVVVSAAPVNVAPTVSAGPDRSVTMPAAVSLAGSVSDDGLPTPPAVTAGWTTVSGPGTVTFANPAAAATTATFSAAGTYVLRLTGSDGALQATDDVTVTVAPANKAPIVNAGLDVAVTLPATASLTGTVSDDLLPNPPGAVTVAWSKVTGPGKVTFSNAGALSTTVTFASAGSFVLRLTGSDGALQTTDDVAVTVSAAAPTSGVLNVAVAAGADDAEERSGSVSLTDLDLDLGFDGTTAQTVGLRFAGLAVPAGAIIDTASVQFTVDEVTSGTASLTVRGQAADNAPAFRAVATDVSSRTRTVANVVWAPGAWTKRGLTGAAQQVTDLAPVVQEIVNRSGWASGNALALVVTGSGTRSAASFERGAGKAAVLHIEWHR